MGIVGITRKTFENKLTLSSAAPPMNPPNPPISSAIANDNIPATAPRVIESRMPTTSRAKISLPRVSVPNKWSFDGDVME